MTFPTFAAYLVLWAAGVLVLASAANGRVLYGRRGTDVRKRKDDPTDEQYLGLGFLIPLLALWQKYSPWNGEERRDHERRSGV